MIKNKTVETMNKLECVIFDIDGTLANTSHRLHFLTQEKKDWDGFYAECKNDKPISEMVNLLNLILTECPVVFVTGRPEKCREDTLEWLEHNTDVSFTDYKVELYMRKDGDHRPDWQVKEEILKELQKDFEIHMVFEDRKQVVDMWRRNGIRCLQVDEGDF